jgi:hypothetical protein
MKRIEIFPDRTRMLSMSLLALAMAFFAYLTIQEHEDILTQLMGLIGCFFFGGISCYFLYRIYQPKAILVLDEAGITDQSTLIAPGFIPWHEIADAEIFIHLGQYFIGIVVTDQSAIHQRMPAWKRILSRTNQELSNFEVCIPVTMLPLPSEKVLKLIKKAIHYSLAPDHSLE